MDSCEKRKFRSTRRPKRRFSGNRFRHLEKECDTNCISSWPTPSTIVSDTDTTRNGSGDNEATNRGITEPRDFLSASASKLTEGLNLTKKRKVCEQDQSAAICVDSDTDFGRGFVDLDLLFGNLLPILVCPMCAIDKIYVNESQKNGLARTFILMCGSCHWEHRVETSKASKGAYDVNRRAVYAFRQLGSGYHSMKTFSTYMNMPSPMTVNSYYKHVTTLKKSSKIIAKQSMAECAVRIHDDHSTENNTLNTAVSVDGTWQKRGYSSLNGVVTAMHMPQKEDKAGKVLDYEVLTKKCKSCEVWEKRDKNSAEYNEWSISHQCKINHQGSSGSMETSGAVSMFNRSVQIHKLQYSEFYGDGDAKSYSEVIKSDPYPGINIVKKECVGHVQERVGTRLRNLKQKEQGLGGKGKLTNAKIDTLQNYFGFAVRNNKGDLEKMKSDIWAGLYHVASTDEHPQHHLCPEGPDSWCKYKNDRENFTHKHGLPNDVLQKIKPIYHELTNNTLLEKCLHGKTQNQNESFNHMIWNRCPKEVYVGRDVLEMAVADAVVAFNEGAVGQLRILRHVGISPGTYTLQGCCDKDRKRMKLANSASTDRLKKRRKVLRAKKKGKSQWYRDNEGTHYAAGEF